jgi:zinc protease
MPIVPGRAAALSLALIACGGINVVHKQGLQLKPVQFPLRTFAFPSGLRVIVEKDSRTPLAGIFVVVGSGSSSDPAGKEGLAHYVEHLAFRTRAGGAESFWNQLDQAGAVERNASTSFDSTNYYEIGIATALPQLLKLEGSRMLAPVAGIPEAERAIELEVVRNELRQRNETGFFGDALAQMQAALFPPGHAYARSIGGSHESLSAIQWSDVEAFATTHYRPDNMTIVIIGDVELATVDKLLASSLPTRLLVSSAPVRPPQRLPSQVPSLPAPPASPDRVARVEASIAAPELWVAWSLPRGFDRDGFLLQFLAGAAQRRFARLMLDDRDIANIQVAPIPGTEASILLCRVELHAAEDPQKTFERLRDEAPRIANDLLRDPNELDTGQRYSATDVGFSRLRRLVLVDELLEAQHLGSRGARRAVVTHFSQDPALYSHALRDIAEIKPERIAEYARPFLTSERARAVLFVPRGETAPVVARAGGAASVSKEARFGTAPKEWMDALLANAPKTTSYTLPNGLTVVLERRADMPLLTASLALAIGPTALLDGGSAAFAQDWGAPGSRANDPSEYGGHVRKRSGDDFIAYVAEGSSGNAEILLATLAEYTRSMKVDRAAPVFYRDLELPWLLRREKEPGWVARKQFFGALLSDHPYGRSPEPAQFENATVDGALDFISRTHSPRNATLAVVGDFEPAEVRKWIVESFGGWGDRSPKLAAPPPATTAAAKGEVRFLPTPRRGATQGEVRFGCLLPEATASAAAARHHLAARLLQDRLWRSLRETAGATYGALARAVTLEGGTAYLEVVADVDNAKLAPGLRETRRTLFALAEAPPGEAELSWARLERAASVAFGQITNDAAAAQIIARAQMGYSLEPGDEQRELESVSAEDVQADFQYCLKSNPTLSLVGEESVIRSAFESGWR